MSQTLSLFRSAQRLLEPKLALWVGEKICLTWLYPFDSLSRCLQSVFWKLRLILATPGLPKTRSGKIMRRVLRKIATKEESELGDVSTLADPSVVDQLLANRP